MNRDTFKLKHLVTTCQPWIGRLTLTNDYTQYIKVALKSVDFILWFLFIVWVAVVVIIVW